MSSPNPISGCGFMRRSTDHPSVRLNKKCPVQMLIVDNPGLAGANEENSSKAMPLSKTARKDSSKSSILLNDVRAPTGKEAVKPCRERRQREKDLSKGSILLNFNKVKPINTRNATRSRVATSDRCFYISATTLIVPLFRLTSLRAFASAAPLVFVLKGRLLAPHTNGPKDVPRCGALS
jgi:hypothetical protein